MENNDKPGIPLNQFKPTQQIPAPISRRRLIKSAFAMGCLTTAKPILDLLGAGKGNKFKIGACDWSLGMANEVEALEFAKKIGLDGVQVSLGNTTNNMHLRQKEVQKSYQKVAKSTGVKIAGLAIGEMNNVPYKSDPVTREWVNDSIDVAKILGCKVVLLAFFHKGDLRGDVEGRKEVIRRLKEVAPKAEKKGIVLGLESWLSAEEHLEIIQKVGSGNVRVYYDVANATEMGYDIYKEMELLGSKYICEVHAKENGNLLGHGKVDFVRVKETLDRIGYEDWIIIEGARPDGANLMESYIANREFLQNLFNH